MIAPVLSKGGVTLAPGKETAMSLVGRLVPQNSEAGLATVSDVFNNFVHGKDSNVMVHGSSTGPSEVSIIL
jgi:cobyric acid synthase